VLDMLLIVRPRWPGAERELAAHPPAGESPVCIWDGLWLQAPDPELCELMREPFGGAGKGAPDACFAQMLVCDVSLQDPRAHERLFDEDLDIMNALSYWRRIWPHRHTHQCACRVIAYDDGTRELARMLTGGLAPCPRPPARDWLSHQEATELARLLAPFAPGAHAGLPARISAAHWALEATLSTSWAELLLPRLVEIVAAMIGHGAGQQALVFSSRTPAVAAELGLRALSAERCQSILSRAQSLRSTALARGLTHDLSTRAGWADYGADICAFETLIGATVRRALEDQSFASSFDADTPPRAQRQVKPAA
jgi:hypothetical protein